ncbi:sel1 repeat family protein [Allosphingosinicella flava]|uniref:Sel1 repeat family protein n=1 Tax=Allosphingosinicella flava TaxID=2771430 RepID=A0A7T2GIQ0_9SPHN|nr:sel1 repeat family protein [Sphingosinicella flava]QPQ54590.1 sel1 repeat family protein [Sphingosinicella flava]
MSGIQNHKAFVIESQLQAAARGEAEALFDLGLAYANGGAALAADPVEAHKWFNLAALNGVEEAKYCRADIADTMTAREIAEAQRRARSWLAAAAMQGLVAA